MIIAGHILLFRFWILFFFTKLGWTVCWTREAKKNCKRNRMQIDWWHIINLDAFVKSSSRAVCYTQRTEIENNEMKEQQQQQHRHHYHQHQRNWRKSRQRRESEKKKIKTESLTIVVTIVYSQERKVHLNMRIVLYFKSFYRVTWLICEARSKRFKSFFLFFLMQSRCTPS